MQKKTHTKQVQEMYTLLKRYHEFENKMAKMKAKRQQHFRMKEERKRTIFNDMQKSLFVWRYNALKQIQRANYEYQQKMSE